MLLKSFPKYRRWTIGAIDCYKRGCICVGCPTFDIIGDRCLMKNSVLGLVRQFGKPDVENFEEKYQIMNESEENEMAKISVKFFDEDLNIEYSEYLKPLIKAVKGGYKHYDELEEITEQSKKNLSVYFDNFYKQLETQGLIQKSDKSKKLAIIDWVQSRLFDREYKDVKPAEPSTTQAGIDYKAEYEKLKSENTKLKEKVSELENRPDTVIDFSEAKQRIKDEIERLKNQLFAIETVEREFLHQTV